MKQQFLVDVARCVLRYLLKILHVLFFNSIHIIIVICPYIICGQNSILRKLLLTFLSTIDDVNANKSEIGYLGYHWDRNCLKTIYSAKIDVSVIWYEEKIKKLRLFKKLLSLNRLEIFKLGLMT